jgi:hypothetical protein
MELMSPTGHDLNDETMLSWFYKSLKRASRIPMSRFESENGGGNIATDSAEMTRDEIKFYNFINRLRSNFKELIVKPIKLQMLIEFPELKDDEQFINQVDIVFNSNQVFEEWKKMNNLSKKSEIVGTLLGVMNGEKPYFHIEWIMDKIFKLTPEDKAENQKYWAKDTGAGASATGEPGEGGDMGAQATPEGGGESQAAPEAQASPEAQAAPEAPAEGGEFEF